MTEHTTIKLARAMLEANLPWQMVLAATEGHYHDFLSPLEMPGLQLMHDLQSVGTPEALALCARHLKGEFDATKEEGDAWMASPEGQAVRARMLRPPTATPEEGATDA